MTSCGGGGAAGVALCGWAAQRSSAMARSSCGARSALRSPAPAQPRPLTRPCTVRNCTRRRRSERWLAPGTAAGQGQARPRRGGALRCVAIYMQRL